MILLPLIFLLTGFPIAHSAITTHSFTFLPQGFAFAFALPRFLFLQVYTQLVSTDPSGALLNYLLMKASSGHPYKFSNLFPSHSPTDIPSL